MRQVSASKQRCVVMSRSLMFHRAGAQHAVDSADDTHKSPGGVLLERETTMVRRVHGANDGCKGVSLRLAATFLSFYRVCLVQT
jgi:hypothetical protein